MISAPGIYFDVPEKDYHADPCVVPSLSSSIAKVLYDQSPRHAHYAHPRLTPNGAVEEATRPMDVGTALHKFMLGRGREVQLVPFDDYRKNDAKTVRDAARAEGRIPLLQTDFEDVDRMNALAVEQLSDMGRGDLFTRCHTEVTLVWQEAHGVWCRSRLDALPKDYETVAHLRLPELKTTAGSADIDTWTGRFFDTGNDIQAAFYRRGLSRLLPTLASVNFEWVVLEQKPPYALNVLTCGNQASAQADTIVDNAIRLWGHCITTGVWPGYDGGVIETTTWRTMQRDMKHAALVDLMAKWQAP